MRERPPRASFTYSTFWATVSASPISRATGKRKCENNQKASAKERVWVRMTMPSSAASACGQRRRTREAAFSTGRHKNSAEDLDQIPEATYSLAREKKKPRMDWAAVAIMKCHRNGVALAQQDPEAIRGCSTSEDPNARRLPCQAPVSLLPFVSQLLTMRCLTFGAHRQ